MSQDEIRLMHRGYRSPVWRVFDAAAIALSPASVMISVLAAIVLQIATYLINTIFPVANVVSLVPTIAGYGAGLPDAEKWIEFVKQIPFLSPWFSMVIPIAHEISSPSQRFLRINGIGQFCVSLAIWSLAGTILCRRSALMFAGNDETTFSRTITFSIKRWTRSAGAPLIPLSVALLLAVMLGVIGLIGRLPYLGVAWLVVTSPVVILFSFAVAVLVFATAVGWPLMVASISTDDCDSFGGLSRAYSALTCRPWQTAGLLILGGFVGLILISLVTVFGKITIACGIASVALGSGTAIADERLLYPLEMIVHWITQGVGISFFWTISVVIYLLLRQMIDGVPLHRLAPDDDPSVVRDPLPVVGMPATDVEARTNHDTQVGAP